MSQSEIEGGEQFDTVITQAINGALDQRYAIKDQDSRKACLARR